MASMATNFLCRSFVTSARMCAQPGYFLYKLIDKEEACAKRAKTLANRVPQVAHSVPKNNTRRQSVLNALYMDTITDILGSEFSVELDEFRIQIHNVRILRNLDVINVYWSSDESGLINLEAAEVLKSLEPKIRKELMAVRHMGIIPRVNFVFYAGHSHANAVTTILNRLRASGELDGVEPAPIPWKDYPQVYGLDREKILRILATRSLPTDFLQPRDETRELSRSQTEAASEDFMQQFRRSKFAEDRLTKRRSKLESRHEKRIEQLLIEEHKKTYQNHIEDQYDDEDEEIHVDNDEPFELSREDEEDDLDYVDDRSGKSWEEEQQDR